MVTGKRLRNAIYLCLLIVMGIAPLAQAAPQSTSSNYGVDEVFFGSGGGLNDCSGNYCAKTSLGETAVGNTASTNYQAQAGNNTGREPYLQFIVTAATVDLGTLTPGTTKTATGTFSVKSYLSSGYVVRTVSDPPSNGSYHMTNLTTQTASNSGAEQFGMNLVKNTNFCGAGCNLGADPVQVPDSTYSHGTVATGYDTPNQFKYVKNDVVAQSTQSSGETDYTISYIFNTTNITPGGGYSFVHVLVATATF